MDEKYMNLALEQARIAFSTYEVPVGAVIIHNGEVVGKGFNQRESLRDPTAHAEIIAIREASAKLGGWRLAGSTIYVTLEPCCMCAGAILNSRIDRLVIGTRDPKGGCCGSVINILNNPKFNHRVEVEFGILEGESSSLLSKFFQQLRSRK